MILEIVFSSKNFLNDDCYDVWLRNVHFLVLKDVLRGFRRFKDRNHSISFAGMIWRIQLLVFGTWNYKRTKRDANLKGKVDRELTQKREPDVSTKFVNSFLCLLNRKTDQNHQNSFQVHIEKLRRPMINSVAGKCVLGYLRYYY